MDGESKVAAENFFQAMSPGEKIGFQLKGFAWNDQFPLNPRSEEFAKAIDHNGHSGYSYSRALQDSFYLAQVLGYEMKISCPSWYARFWSGDRVATITAPKAAPNS